MQGHKPIQHAGLLGLLHAPQRGHKGAKGMLGGARGFAALFAALLHKGQAHKQEALAPSSARNPAPKAPSMQAPAPHAPSAAPFKVLATWRAPKHLRFAAPLPMRRGARALAFLLKPAQQKAAKHAHPRLGNTPRPTILVLQAAPKRNAHKSPLAARIVPLQKRLETPKGDGPCGAGPCENAHAQAWPAWVEMPRMGLPVPSSQPPERAQARKMPAAALLARPGALARAKAALLRATKQALGGMHAPKPSSLQAQQPHADARFPRANGFVLPPLSAPRPVREEDVSVQADAATMPAPAMPRAHAFQAKLAARPKVVAQAKKARGVLGHGAQPLADEAPRPVHAANDFLRPHLKAPALDERVRAHEAVHEKAGESLALPASLHMPKPAPKAHLPQAAAAEAPIPHETSQKQDKVQPSSGAELAEVAAPDAPAPRESVRGHAEHPAPMGHASAPQPVARAWEGLVQAVVRGERVLEMQLDPPHLGKLHARIALDEGRHVHVWIAAGAEARHLIAAQLPQLREALEAQGFVLGSFVCADQEHQGGGRRHDAPWGEESTYSAAAGKAAAPQSPKPALRPQAARDGRLSILV